MQAQKSPLQSQTGNGAQQPAHVVARSAQHGMQRVALSAFEPATLQPVVALGMSNGRLNGLAATQPAALQLGEAFELAAVVLLKHAQVKPHPEA